MVQHAFSSHTIRYGNANAHLSELLEITLNQQVFILTDVHVHRFILPLLPELAKHHFIILSSGEENKSFSKAIDMYDVLIKHQATKSDVLIGIGGGSITDLAGFVASTYKRGMQFVSIPTTLMGMVDAAIGGKNAINYQSYKNMIGTFSFPDQLYIDPIFLSTLPKVNIFDGWAECVKHSIIEGGILFQNMLDINPEEPAQIQSLLREFTEVKLKIVGADPFEKNERRKLNFGHTCAHAWESVAIAENEELSHGKAVGWGMQVALLLSVKYQSLDPKIAKKIITKLKTWYGIPPLEWIEHPQFREALNQDKKNSGNEILMVLCKAPGEIVYHIPIQFNAILEVCKEMYHS